MDIKIYILERHAKGQYVKPIEYRYTGNYALEIMFFRISEIYFGNQVSLQIQSVIKNRVFDDKNIFGSELV
jgi:hypothetical protein